MESFISSSSNSNFADRLSELDDIRDFIDDAKRQLETLHVELDLPKPNFDEMFNQKCHSSSSSSLSSWESQPDDRAHQSFSMIANNYEIDRLPPTSVSKSTAMKINRGDTFLRTDLINAFHKISAKQSDHFEKTVTQSKEEARILARKRSKQKKNIYSSKRLSYTEILRTLIEHQNEVIASLKSIKRTNCETNKQNLQQ